MSLTLETVRLTHVRIPLVEPFAISNGVIVEKDAIVIEMKSGGLTGIGEASPMAGSFYSHHTPDSSWDVLVNHLIPKMQASTCLDLSGSWLGKADDPFAACGIDSALWDLAAREKSMPLWKLLGGRDDRPVESGLAVGILPTVQQLCDRIEYYLRADGYRRVKIKVQPGWDTVPLEAIRDRFGTVALMVDANCAYRREHIEHIASWDRFGLMMLEQPLPREDLEGHAALARRCRTPICLDEGAESVAAVERALQLGAASIINIKLQRLGSLAAARRVHDLTAAADVGCWMGTMPELAIGGYGAVHFASLPNIVYPTDVEASSRWFVADITRPPICCRDGCIELPGGPGLGVELDPEVIARYKVREHTARLSCRLECDPWFLGFSGV